jgi:N-acetylmuramic acid 6-phosphate etherase
MERLSSEDLARLIVSENSIAVEAAEAAAPQLAKAIDIVADCFLAGGRVLLVGAGTSARIAASDAAELPPTFGVDPGRFVAIVAGGAIDRAKEGAEDDLEAAKSDLARVGATTGDVLIGISASGTTPYVLAMVAEASSLGLITIGIANNPDSSLPSLADIPILLNTGAEVLTGSTRLKAGTAQKIALNAISTGAMVRAGRVTGNEMTYMTPKNEKLRGRAARIIAEQLGVDEDEARSRLESVGWDIQRALDSQ